ncbi:hypothetical protein [Comamonas sp. NLF-1-9]|uniref:hypothetical protein n=1 Tax=Comamonas sp. NLF-1-9 TaxID=2853163 RepID=UPI001C44DFC1|nr:hypothetical protein [Comamonas sp. NLF-1-9]QXL85223.1 hypothetical protein KUD94_04415 [Comamonas sp. NLF-1-9]
MVSSFSLWCAFFQLEKPEVLNLLAQTVKKCSILCGHLREERVSPTMMFSVEDFDRVFLRLSVADGHVPPVQVTELFCSEVKGREPKHLACLAQHLGATPHLFDGGGCGA